MAARELAFFVLRAGFSIGFSMSEPAAKRTCASSSVDLSLEAIISRCVGGFVGPSPSGTASLAIISYSSGRTQSEHLELRKLWDAASAPRIEIVRHRRGEIVLFALELTRTNSMWAADWLIDHMEEKLIYDPDDMDSHLEATLAIFNLPPTDMTFRSDQSLPGPAWLQSFEDDTSESTPKKLAQKVHIKAQQEVYKADRERRLRSMART